MRMGSKRAETSETSESPSPYDCENQSIKGSMTVKGGGYSITPLLRQGETNETIRVC